MSMGLWGRCACPEVITFPIPNRVGLHVLLIKSNFTLSGYMVYQLANNTCV